MVSLHAWTAFTGAGEAPCSFSAPPRRVLAAYALSEVAGVLAEADAEALRGAHVVGVLSYEAAPALEPAARVPHEPVLPGFPLAHFSVFDAKDVSGDGAPGAAAAWEVPLPPLPPPCTSCAVARAPPPMAHWRESCSREEYDAAFGRVHDAIRDGIVYQVNHTLRLEAAWGEGDCGVTSAKTPPPLCPVCLQARDLHFFRSLLRAQRGGFGAYLEIAARAEGAPSFRLLSASPELFFSWHRGGEGDDGKLRTRPMKGTRPRGLSPAHDRALQQDLVCSAKDLAENLMIVDLLRNDVSRVALRGSVRVSAPFAVSAFPTVWQMTTDVSATVARDTSLLDILRALFPCGSVTGAPKLSAMALIAELEGGQGRGAYCGALLHLSPGGSVTASVPIRTLVVSSTPAPLPPAGHVGQSALPPTSVAVYGCGGGITWDSDACGEWEEARAKAAVLRAASEDVVASARTSTGADGGGDNHISSSFLPPSQLASPLVHRPWFSLLETLRLCVHAAPRAANSSQQQHLCACRSIRTSDCTSNPSEMVVGRPRFVLEDEHLARLEATARHCAFAWDGDAARAALAAVAAAAVAGGSCCDLRVRLLLNMEGVFSTESSPCATPFRHALKEEGGALLPPLQTVLLSVQPITRHHPLLYIKTTDRRVYTEPYAATTAAAAAAATVKGDGAPVLDVLLFNEDGEVTEFSIGSLVAEVSTPTGGGNGGDRHLCLVTPPVECGLLPGVFRQHLLTQGLVTERRLTLQDVRAATRLWLVNSVRGWCPVELQG